MGLAALRAGQDLFGLGLQTLTNAKRQPTESASASRVQRVCFRKILLIRKTWTGWIGESARLGTPQKSRRAQQEP